MSGRPSAEELGQRIERLLAETRSLASPPVRERVEALLSSVLELHAAGFARIAARLDLAPVLDDPLVANLLVLHGQNPEDTATRVGRALAHVRPYLGSHGGDVELVSVDVASGVARLRLTGSCDGCPSSTATVKLAVEGAVQEMAPEITRVEVEGVRAETLLTPRWVEIEPAGSAPEIRDVGARPLVVCRVDGALYAYRDGCPGCGASFARAEVHDGALRCPGCEVRFDLRCAGLGLDGTTLQLEPVPLLARGEAIEVALAEAAP